ncbi:MAG: ATP-binding cassette domain-containing protein, partial [Candidatus Coproplasma sp.]
MKIENLSVSYGKKVVYENFNLEFDEGGITCLLGESGCGKSTVASILMG